MKIQMTVEVFDQNPTYLVRATHSSQEGYFADASNEQLGEAVRQVIDSVTNRMTTNTGCGKLSVGEHVGLEFAGNKPISVSLSELMNLLASENRNKYGPRRRDRKPKRKRERRMKK